MLPLFRLAEWELPSELVGELEKPADARVFAKFMGVRQEVLLRKVVVRPGTVLLFARAEMDEDGEENDDEASWVFAESENEWVFPATWPSLMPSDEWRTNFFNSEFGRVFFLEGCLAFLMSDGRGSWRILNGTDNNGAPFFWGDGATNWAKRPAREWLEQLKIEIQNPGCDARFALDFAFAANQKRNEFCVLCKSGTVAQFYAIWRWIVLCDPDLESETLVALSLEIDAEMPVSLFLSVGCDDYFEPENTHFCEQWLARLENQFQPRVDSEKIGLHFALRNYASDSSVWAYIHCNNISHHERIEAHKNLRDWARQHNISIPEIQI